jgi:hypothetical protein
MFCNHGPFRLKLARGVISAADITPSVRSPSPSNFFIPATLRQIAAYNEIQVSLSVKTQDHAYANFVMLECGLHYLNVVLHYQNTDLHSSEESPQQQQQQQQ